MKEKSVFNGNIIAKPGEIYLFEEITGNIDARGEDTRTAFPKLASVGGYIYASGDFTHVKTNDTTANKTCSDNLLFDFKSNGYCFFDGILAKIVSQRGPVIRVIVCGKTKVSYVVSDEEFHSHGETLKQAHDGLLYKIGTRDTSEFKSWTLSKSVSKRDAIRAYRTITGACESGVKAWVEREERPETITMSEVIKITEGAYGNDVFRKFFESGENK